MPPPDPMISDPVPIPAEKAAGKAASRDQRKDRRQAQGHTPGWRDHYWWSHDGLRLHARHYPAQRGAAGPPLLCIPGLTRNARDFEALAPALAAYGDVYALDLRGRGESAYAADPMSYVPLTYVQDVVRLLDGLDIGRCAIIGTSLGGIVGMILAAAEPGRVAGLVLNDVGPAIEQAGLARIRSYVGAAQAQPTWLHAARMVAATNAGIYPDFGIDDWLRMVKRSHRLSAEGRIVPDYDRRIAEPFRMPGGEAGVDLWPAYKALKAIPILIVRGALSDILAADIATEMAAYHPAATLLTLPAVGHAPTLDEPEAATAIAAWAQSLAPAASPAA